MIIGNVFSIEEFSTFDGPGIRTTVFLKGCPLRCQWCHNPEGQEFENSILRSPNGCLGCGKCKQYALEQSGHVIYTEESMRACPQHLLRWCATQYTPQALVEKIKKNAAILNASGGGVTFSGGEPLSQHLFLTECLRQLRGVTNRAIQTSGFAPSEIFQSVLKETDLVLYDIKLVNASLHRHYTGVRNDLILKNFESLVCGNVPYLIRTPLVPGVTDTNENLSQIAALLNNFGVDYIELLPYNPMAGAKYPLAGMQFCPDYDTTAASNLDTTIFEQMGIHAKIV